MKTQDLRYIAMVSRLRVPWCFHYQTKDKLQKSETTENENRVLKNVAMILFH